MKAIWNDQIIAESDNCILLEGNYYFPIAAVKSQYLKPSPHHSTCPWKGEASYYHVVINNQVNENAAWYYPQPKEAAKQIKGYVAFWNGVKVVDAAK